MHPNYKQVYTKEEIYDLYVLKKMTAIQIANIYNVSKPKVLQDLKRFNITYQDKLNSYKASNIHHDLIIGSLLGDGTFVTDGGDYRMSFRQAENQKRYLFFKFELMKKFCKKQTTGVTDWNKKISENAQTMHYFHTRALPVFNAYKKMSIVEALTELNDNSFSIWLMDDGTLYKKNYPKHTPYYTLSIKRFKKEEAEYAKEILQKKFNIKSTINDIHKDYYDNGNKFEVNNIYFPTSETLKIVEIIKGSDFGEELQTTMEYKLL